MLKSQIMKIRKKDAGFETLHPLVDSVYDIRKWLVFFRFFPRLSFMINECSILHELSSVLYTKLFVDVGVVELQGRFLYIHK